MQRFPETPPTTLLSCLRTRSGPWISLLFLFLAFGLMGSARAAWLSNPVFAQGPWSKAPANELFKPSCRETVLGTKRRIQGKGTPLEGDGEDSQAHLVLALLSYWPAITRVPPSSIHPVSISHLPFPRSLRTEPLNPRAPPLAS